jgi:hypothetical protein
MYNPLTCAGWEGATTGWIAAGGCLAARLGFVFLFFLVFILRKWFFELIMIPFNVFTSLIGSLLTYLIIIIIFGSFKWALALGVAGIFIFGIVGAIFFGETESD